MEAITITVMIVGAVGIAAIVAALFAIYLVLKQAAAESGQKQKTFLEQIQRLVERSLADFKNQMDITQDASKRHLDATISLLADAEKRIATANQRFMDDQIKAFTAMTSSLAEVVNGQRDALKNGLATLQLTQMSGTKEQSTVLEHVLGKLSEALEKQSKTLEDAIQKETRAMEGVATGLEELKKVIKSDIEVGLPAR